MPVSIEFPTEVLLNTAITPDSEWTTNQIILIEAVACKIPYLFVPEILENELSHHVKLPALADDDLELIECVRQDQSPLSTKARTTRIVLRVFRQAPPVHVLIKCRPSALGVTSALTDEQKIVITPLLEILQTRTAAEIRTVTRIAEALFTANEPLSNHTPSPSGNTNREKSNSPSKRGLEEAQRCSSLPKPKIAKQIFECCCCKRVFDNRHNHSAHESSCIWRTEQSRLAHKGGGAPPTKRTK